MLHADNNLIRISVPEQLLHCCLFQHAAQTSRRRSDVMVCRRPNKNVEGLLGLDRENAIAIESEAGYSLNVLSGQTGICA